MRRVYFTTLPILAMRHPTCKVDSKRIGFLCGINKPRKGREGLDYPLALITIKNTRAGFMARDL